MSNKKGDNNTMNELIEIKLNETNDPVVSGRDLYKFLNIGTRYNDWIPRMLDFGFIENIDYVTVTQKKVTAQGNEISYIDHIMTLDMAKHIAMVQRNNRGMQIRDYFLEIERKFKDPTYIMARALKYSEITIQKQLEEIKGLTLRIEQDKPKTEYYDKVLNTSNEMTTTVIAKSLGISAQALNRFLHNEGIIYKQSDSWFFYTKYQDKGYGAIATVTYMNKEGVECTKHYLKWTEKGREFIVNLWNNKEY